MPTTRSRSIVIENSQGSLKNFSSSSSGKLSQQDELGEGLIKANQQVIIRASRKVGHKKLDNENSSLTFAHQKRPPSPLTLPKLWKAKSRRRMVTVASQHKSVNKEISLHSDHLQKARIQDKFTKLELIGSGAYGTVYRAIDRRNHKTVALKRIKLNNHDTEEDGVPSSSLREIGLLKDLNHPNVLRLLEVQTCENQLYLVFEHLDLDLKKLLDRHKQGLSQPLARSYMWQLLNGLAYCHSRRILHRDLKLQNLLVDRLGNIKLADFGLARSISLPIRTYTHEVVTLWYRSPELLLKAIHYGPWVDLWSLGCIFAEMLTNKILFQGDSEIDQLYRIFRTLGTPDEVSWPGFEKMPEYRSFSKFKGRDIEEYIGNDNELAVDLLKKFLTYDPARRISAIDALRHEYLVGVSEIDPSTLRIF